MKDFHSKPALLTKTELEWLRGGVKISKTYQYRIKSDIRKKLKTFTELEIPLLINKGISDNIDLSIFTQNVRANPQINNYDFRIESTNKGIPSQNMVGRKGFEPSNPAMSRRYLNQARPPALALRQHKNFVPLTVNAISF